MTAKRHAPKAATPVSDMPARVVASATPTPGLIARLGTVKGAIVAIASVGAVLGGLAGYWNAYQAARSSMPLAQLLALAAKSDAGPLSIVVLPFVNLTGDPQQAYVADGLTVAITGDLVRIRDAAIISTATAFAYKDKTITVQQIGKELGVRFALQGSVQRNGDKLRISAHLVDVVANTQLWSESFEGTQGDLFALQDMVTTRVGTSIGREMIIIAARDSEMRKGNANVTDLLLRALAVNLRPESRTKWTEQQALFRQALQIEPSNVTAMARLASSLSTEAYNGHIADPVARERQFAEARDWALRAKDLGAQDARIMRFSLTSRMPTETTLKPSVWRRPRWRSNPSVGRPIST
jgi:TolB-like protein